MALQCRLRYFWWLMTVFLLFLFPMTDSVCTIPTSLQNGNWIYNTTTSIGPRSLELTVGTSKFSSGSDWINAQGTKLNSFSCFANLSLSSQETVVVMRSDNSYTDFGDVRWVYMCMKLTEVTKDLYYLYLLSDEDNTVYPGQRIYSPASGINHLDTDPVCGTFCTYNTQINNTDYSTLQKDGTSDSLPSGISFCPCNESCAAGAYELTNAPPTQQGDGSDEVSTPPAIPQRDGNSEGLSLEEHYIVIGTVLGGLVLIFLLCSIICCCMGRRKRSKSIS